jgi:hypothetical protein
VRAEASPGLRGIKGATYYDSTWQRPLGSGAMMEIYEKPCLPSFPISNHFTCAFISLGDVPFFVSYEQDRPKGMPPVCIFAQESSAAQRLHQPPPYSSGDGEDSKTNEDGFVHAQLL